MTTITTGTINLTFAKQDETWFVRAAGEGADQLAGQQVTVVKRNGKSKHVHLGALVGEHNDGSLAWYEIARDETYAERRVARVTANAERAAEAGSYADMNGEQLRELVAACEHMIEQANRELATR